MVRSFFPPALFAAVLIHLFFFAQVVFVMRGNAQEYKIDLTFLGSILRKQDIASQIYSRDEQIPVLEPSGLSEMVLSKSWELGVIVDKPLLKACVYLPVSPMKFITERVVMDDKDGDVVSGIPEAPQIRLRGRF